MDLLTVREAAEWLHVNRNYVYRLITCAGEKTHGFNRGMIARTSYKSSKGKK